MFKFVVYDVLWLYTRMSLILGNIYAEVLCGQLSWYVQFNFKWLHKETRYIYKKINKIRRGKRGRKEKKGQKM